MRMGSDVLYWDQAKYDIVLYGMAGWPNIRGAQKVGFHSMMYRSHKEYACMQQLLLRLMLIRIEWSTI